MRVENTGLVIEQSKQFLVIEDVDNGFERIAVANHEIPELIKALQEIQTQLENQNV